MNNENVSLMSFSTHYEKSEFGAGNAEHGECVAELILQQMTPHQPNIMKTIAIPIDRNQNPQSHKKLEENNTAMATFPPGIAGEIVQYIYHNSYLSVAEVAIAATLGLLAGVCGRAFEGPSNKDLALYIILVARSGIGKDGIHDGIPKLINLATTTGSDYFVRAQDFASGPALHKELLSRPGFLNLQGEFGRKLKSMANLSNSPMQDFRTTMTNCYAKDFYEGKTYSDAEKSIRGVRWPALSFLGETTPDTFAESLTTDMMEDGFMSRFLVIDYNGPRPQPNMQRGEHSLSRNALIHLQTLIHKALPYQGVNNIPNSRNIVNFADTGSKEIFYRFELECGDKINSSDDDAERQVWNRAHLKALKVACVLAAIDNPTSPHINSNHSTWAINLIRRDIASFSVKHKNGEIGNSDDARIRKLFSLIVKYFTERPAPSYKITDWMWKSGVIPRSYFQTQTSKHRSFTSHKSGQTAALDFALRNMVESGYITEMKKDKAFEEFGEHSRCFRIINIPDWAR